MNSTMYQSANIRSFKRKERTPREISN